MRRTGGKRSLFWVILMSLTGCAAGDGQVIRNDQAALKEPPPELERADNLCLNLAPSRSEVLLGEPVLLIVGLENCSTTAIQARKLLAIEYGLLSVRVLPPSGEEFIYAPPVRKDGRGTRTVELAPGEMLVEDIAVYFGRDGWLLGETGVYRFQASYPVDVGEVVSTPVEIRVREPDTEAGYRAAKSFMADRVARYFYLGGGEEAGVEALEELATNKDYSGTSWADFAATGLSVSGREEPDPGALRTLADPAIAAAAGREILGEVPLASRDAEAARLATELEGSAESDLVAEWIRRTLRGD